MLTLDNPITPDEQRVLDDAWTDAMNEGANDPIAVAAARCRLTLYRDRPTYRIYRTAGGRWALANEHGFWPLHDQGR